MTWTVSTLNEQVDAEIRALPSDARARLVCLAAIIGTHGLDALPDRIVDDIGNGIRELQISTVLKRPCSVFLTVRAGNVFILGTLYRKTRLTPMPAFSRINERATELA